MTMTATSFTEQVLAILDKHERNDSPMWAAYDRMYETQTLDERRAFAGRIWADFAAENLPSGMLLANAGLEVSLAMIERLRRFRDGVGVREPVCVRVED